MGNDGTPKGLDAKRSCFNCAHSDECPVSEALVRVQTLLVPNVVLGAILKTDLSEEEKQKEMMAITMFIIAGNLCDKFEKAEE